MKDLKKAIANGNHLETPRFVGECVNEMPLHPEESKVTIK